MSNAFSRTLLAVAVAMAASAAIGGQVSSGEDGRPTWEDESDGVVIEWNRDGTFHRIFSRESHDVHFDDRAGIRKAQVIAEEKAKAALVRFMKEESESDRLVTRIDSDIKKATRVKHADGTTSSSKQVEKTMVETMREVTRSWSSGTLQGVVVLEKGYDPKEEEAWVKVGISSKTIGTARALTGALADENHSAVPVGAGAEGRGPAVEIRRTRMTDW